MWFGCRIQGLVGFEWIGLDLLSHPQACIERQSSGMERCCGELCGARERHMPGGAGPSRLPAQVPYNLWTHGYG